MSKEPRVRPSLSEIASIIRRQLRDDDLEITARAYFAALPGWDEMDLMRVVVEVECRFDVHFNLTEFDRLETVGDLLRAAVVKQALEPA
jgi:acyl carrier protein